MPPTPHRPETAVVYICTDDAPVGLALCADWCRDLVTAAGLAVAHVVAEPDPRTAVADRAGWRQVVEWAASGQVGSVITMNRRMVANSPHEWAHLTAELHALGVELRTLTSLSAPRADAA
ncbi:hypothetical protein [Kitasatospora aureofaciens]|uniref:hypothetical protein n=1 Tax=Kitasatospora aureofaciens TaxID=1894 RepID=UPI0021094411|nr:hypothetical protein [Kitasatospora aureofaciens]